MNARVDLQSLPADFPTHRHDAMFWEHLGRAVGTFGFLEEVLGKAIFSFMATRPFELEEIDAAFEEWLGRLERALADPLGKLIGDYGKVVQEHPEGDVHGLDDLLSELHGVSRIRNVLCHGSWQLPDGAGASIPRFVERRGSVFDDPIDCEYLRRVQEHVAALSCAVISSVTGMGWQFPGSGGPGRPIVGV